jgi:hypothetical protein
MQSRGPMHSVGAPANPRPARISVSTCFGERAMESKRRSTRGWRTAAILILCISAAPTKTLAQRTVSGSSTHPQDGPAIQTGVEAAGESRCKEWSAWYKAQPAGPKTLHVSATCTFFTTGYEVKLKPRATHDTDAEVYVFDLAIIPPKGVGPISFVIRYIPVEYVEKTEHRYYLVRIEPDHVTVPVTVIQ